MWQTLRRLTEAPERLAVGIISGTSADGIDTVLVRLRGAGPETEAEVLAFQTFPWPPELRRAVLECPLVGTAAHICVLNVEVGRTFAACALALMHQARVSPQDVAFIASHGQTIWHNPRGGAATASTLQIGDGAEIAARTGCLAITDFRTADIALGGGGAPLVPLADTLLFGKEGARRVALNLGGIANVTLLEGRDPERALAFDTGPANCLIDHIAEQAEPGAGFDAEGKLAVAGSVDEALLREWLAHDYFEQEPPKSTGRELFSRQFLKPHIETDDPARLADLAATATEFTAQTVAAQMRRWLPKPEGLSCVIAAGGGVRNPELMRRLRAALDPLPVETSSAHGIDPDAREAIAFAIIGNQTLHGLPGNAAAATGAAKGAVLGKISLPADSAS